MHDVEGDLDESDDELPEYSEKHIPETAVSDRDKWSIQEDRKGLLV